jgi:uncharacterized delta-60 repeat protein
MATINLANPGTLDTSFGGVDGIAGTQIASGSKSFFDATLAIQADGKILVGGSVYGSNHPFGVLRFNANGTIDNTFSGDGYVEVEVGAYANNLSGIFVQSDGKILVSGYTNSLSELALVRYTSTGGLDTMFGGGDGIVRDTLGGGLDHVVKVQSNGKIVVAFSDFVGSDYDFALMRFNADGTRDTSFGGGDGHVSTPIGSGSDYVNDLAIQSDGKIVVVGESTTVSGPDFTLVRYNTDGTLDASFSGDGKVATSIGTQMDEAFGVVVQANGDIIVAGTSQVNLERFITLACYNSNGTLDTTFDGDGILKTAIDGG